MPTGIHVHFNLTHGFWHTTNQHWKCFWLTTNMYLHTLSQVVLRLPRTSWGYTCLTRLTTQLQVHNIPTFEGPLQNIIDLLTNTYIWHKIDFNHESIPQNHIKFHLVVHHPLIAIVAPLPHLLKLFTSWASFSLSIKSWNSMLNLSFVRVDNSYTK